MKIVRATASDTDTAMGIVQASTAHMAAQGIDQWDAIYPNREGIGHDIADGALYLAVENGLSRGMIVLNEIQSKQYEQVKWLHEGGRILVVHRLAIVPEAQRQGVASRLMDFAEQMGREQGYSAIRLDAFTKNPAAMALYAKRGYRWAGTVEFRKGLFHCYEKGALG